MRVALVHYWLLGMRGGEKVLEAMCRLFPEADIFTLFYDPEAVSPLIRSRNVHVSFLNPLRGMYRSLLPLMPVALEHFDLRGYDLVISSESGPAKYVLVSSQARHVCYCHTPMRYLWELYPAYCHEFRRGFAKQILFSLFASHLRTLDYASAARVDAFLANSRNVRRRIWRAYRRRSRVVYPPVPAHDFRHEASRGYFLMVSEMVPDKRLDYAIRCVTRTGRRLKVVGGGPEYKALRRIAGPNVEFCGRVSDADLRELYSRCAALIVPGEEDFGMTLVESLASGKPVIALEKGGASEIVTPGCGFLFGAPDEPSLSEALQAFDRRERFVNPAALMARSRDFSEEAFQTRFLAGLARTPAKHTGRAAVCVGS
ncbi:MAG TPA: glycosyltransferase [Bryobacteraceae bacterium]|nr:glycosyltransferase [Bryobacteraceae bacterium]